MDAQREHAIQARSRAECAISEALSNADLVLENGERWQRSAPKQTRPDACATCPGKQHQRKCLRMVCPVLCLDNRHSQR